MTLGSRAKIYLVMISVVLPIICIVSIPLIVRAIASHKRTEANEMLSSMAVSANARIISRPSLRGRAETAEAWAKYEMAFLNTPLSAQELSILKDYCMKPFATDRTKVDLLLSANAQQIEEMQRGENGNYGVRQRAWDKVYAQGVTSVTVSIVSVATLATAKAKNLTESGQSLKAAELLLDTMQMSLDTMRDATDFEMLFGLEAFWRAVDGLKTLLLSSTLPKKDLLEIVRQLTIIDESFPPLSVVLKNTALALGFDLMASTKTDDYIERRELRGGASAGYRHLFCNQLLLTDSVAVNIEVARIIEKTEHLAWSDLRPLANDLDTEMSTKNPLIALIRKTSGLKILGLCTQHRFHQARLRLLRLATNIMAEGQMLPARDPFGDTIRSEILPGRFKLWSVGANGTDEGGEGGWNSLSSDDIVLETNK